MLNGWWPAIGVACGLVVGRPWRHRARPFVVPPGGTAPGRSRGKQRAPDTDRAVAAALPEVVDLLLLGVGAGLAPRESLERCRDVLPAPFDAAVARARRRWSAGEGFGPALESGLAPLGPRARPLLAVLVAGERDGVALRAALQRAGDEARRRRRVEAQERARRLPVLMLLPLVCCVLPAFVLLALTPVVLASLEELQVI